MGIGFFVLAILVAGGVCVGLASASMNQGMGNRSAIGRVDSKGRLVHGGRLYVDGE